MRPIVSILLPVKKAAETLEETLISISQQTFDKFELLVIDDHSTDHTKTILQTWVSKDPRIQLFINNGKGLVAALNYGKHPSHCPYGW